MNKSRLMELAGLKEATRYTDSGDFTADLFKIGAMIASDKMTAWAKETDNNMEGKGAVAKLAALRKAMEAFEDEMLSEGERPAYKAGRKAGYKRSATQTNPHDKGTKEYDEYDIGFEHGKKEFQAEQ